MFTNTQEINDTELCLQGIRWRYLDENGTQLADLNFRVGSPSTFSSEMVITNPLIHFAYNQNVIFSKTIAIKKKLNSDPW